MAPTIAIPPSSNYTDKHQPMLLSSKKKTVTVSASLEMEELKKRNEELERELRESKEREDELMRQLSKAWERVRVAEEAEEMLCSQLGDLEVDAVEQARLFHSQISDLTSQLSRAQLLLPRSSSSSSS
ncbi:hypothetical protein RND81_05G050400 [Saponaria officinalis]|uniref:Uncharacterized protein n=1 Tax=Saponaria officinalis TaxID=3572 RepID=A0AAW1KTD3_SAPOF